jgi:hypothetical protein
MQTDLGLTDTQYQTAVAIMVREADPAGHSPN